MAIDFQPDTAKVDFQPDTPKIDFKPVADSGRDMSADVISATKPESLIPRTYNAVRESLSPLLGPTDQQKLRDSVQMPDGSFQYKPAGGALEQQGAIPAAIQWLSKSAVIPDARYAPNPNDSLAVAAGKAVVNQGLNLESFITSPLGVGTALLGTSELSLAKKLVAGAFTADMLRSVPGQVNQARTGATAQEKIEGGLGAVASLAFAGLGAHELLPEGKQITPLTAEAVKAMGVTSISGETREHELIPEANFAPKPEIPPPTGSFAKFAADERASLTPATDAAIKETTPEATPSPAVNAIHATEGLHYDRPTQGMDEADNEFTGHQVTDSKAVDKDGYHATYTIPDTATPEEVAKIVADKREQFSADTETNSAPATRAEESGVVSPGSSVEEESTNAGAGELGSTLEGVDSGGSSVPAPVEANPDLAAQTTPPKPAEEVFPSPNGAPEGGDTSIKNSVVDAEREARGIPERSTPESRSFDQLNNEAKATLQADPHAGEALVTNLKEKIRPLTDMEDAILTHEQVKRQAEYDNAADAVNSAKSPEELATAKTRLAVARDKVQDIYEVGSHAGTENARGLNARRMMLKDDYSLSRMEARARAENGGQPLSEDRLAEVKALHDRIADLESKLEVHENKRKDDQTAQVFKQMTDSLKKEVVSGKKQGKSVLDTLREGRDQALKNIRERTQTANAGIDPTVLADVARIAAFHIADGAVKIADFTKRLVQDVGEWVRPHAEDFFEKAKQAHADASKAVEPVKPGDVVAKAKANSEAGGELNPQHVYDLARAHVNAGVEGVDAVMKAVHGDLAPLHEGLTERQVRDAFSGYGKIKFPSKEEDLAKLREYRRVSQLMSAIEDANKGEAPKKTGLQRDKASPDVRDKMKELEKAMRDNGIETSSPEQQLASANTARATSLRNQIEDLDRRLGGGPKIEKGKPVPDNDEVKALRAERDTKKDQLQKIEDAANPPKTEDDKKVEAIEKRIADVKERIAKGDIDPLTGKPTVDIQKLAERKAELNGLNKQISDLRKAAKPKPSQEEKAAVEAQKGVDSAAAALDHWDRILKGEIPPPTAKIREPKTDLEESLLSQVDAMKRAAAEIRRAALPKSDPQAIKEKAQLAALDKSVADYERKIRDADFSSKGKTNGPDTENIAKAKALRDLARAAYEALKKAQMIQDQIRLDNYKKSLKKQTDTLRDRVAKSDYAPRPKTATVLDNEAINLKTERDRVRQQFEEGLIKDKLANRTTGAKMADAAVSWSRTAKLASFKVFPKLLEAAVFRSVFEPLGRIAGQPLRIIAPDVYQKAYPEAGASVKAAATYISTGLTSWGKAWEKLRTGKTNIDVILGKRSHDAEMFNFVGNAHGMVKEPLRQASMEASKQLRLEQATYRGIDPNDPIVQTGILSGAAEDANRQLFTNPNHVTKYLVKVPIGALKNAKTTGLPALGRTMEFLMPIMNVSSNIAVHTLRLNPLVGFSEFATRMAIASKNGELANGAAKLSDADAALLSRVFKTATLGTVLSAYAWTHPQYFGGIWEEGSDSKKALKHDEVKIFGVTLPGWMNHAPEIAQLNTVASARRVYDRYIASHPGDNINGLRGAEAFALMSPVKHFPFIDTYIRMFSETKSADRTLGAMARDSVIPAAVTSILGSHDKQHRAPQNAVDEIKMGIPFLRNQVPVKRAR